MLWVILISVLAVICMVALVFFKPAVAVGRTAVSIFWVPPFLGALLLLACGHLSGGEIIAGLTADTAVNPLKILVLFFSMTLMSVFLDEAGFFRYLAGVVLHRAGKSRRALFLYLYLAVSVLTVFTSNDIVVLTFTPFICYFCKNADMDPLPFLFCEFVAANTWSMGLLIGNPTNIYLCGAGGVTFLEYVGVMLLPTVLGGLASLGMLWLLFGRELASPMQCHLPPPLPMDKPTVVLGLVALGGCLVMLVLSSVLQIEMWLVALFAALFLYLAAPVQLLFRRASLRVIGRSFLRAPLDVVPFVLSMFVLVLGLSAAGVTARLATLLSGGGEVWRYGISSMLAANLVNNIPMSVLYSSIIGAAGNSLPALYAAVIGSNVGAFLTPVGALAGIMWMAMLKNHGVKLSFARFSLLGAVVALPTLLAALLGLWIVM